MATHYCVLLAAAALSFQADGTNVTREQFLRLIQSQHSRLTDVEFVYEGAKGPIRSNGDFEKTDNLYPITYQGLYAFSDQGNAYLGRYEDYSSEVAFAVHEIKVLKDGELEVFARTSDSNQVLERTEPGGLSSLNFGGSPHRFLYEWLLHELVQLNQFDYESRGWSNLGGERCLQVVVTLGESSPGNEDAPNFRMWLDLNCGAQPRQVEYRLGEAVAYRCRVTRLESFRLPSGDSIWFPLAAEVDVFNWESRSSKPIGKETYSIVPTSLLFNQGLSKEDFRVDWRGGVIHPGLIPAKSRFESVLSPETIRTDPVGVEETIRRQVTEADAQSRQLDASAAAVLERSPSNWWRLGFLACGIALIVLAVHMARRHR